MPWCTAVPGHSSHQTRVLYLTFCPWSIACLHPQQVCPQPISLSCGVLYLGSDVWIDQKPHLQPMNCSNQNSTSFSQESETRSRTGERRIYPFLIFTGLAVSFFPWELWVRKGRGELKALLEFIPGGETTETSQGRQSSLAMPLCAFQEFTTCISILDFFPSRWVLLSLL